MVHPVRSTTQHESIGDGRWGMGSYPRYPSLPSPSPPFPPFIQLSLRWADRKAHPGVAHYQLDGRCVHKRSTRPLLASKADAVSPGLCLLRMECRATYVRRDMDEKAKKGDGCLVLTENSEFSNRDTSHEI